MGEGLSKHTEMQVFEAKEGMGIKARQHLPHSAG